MADRRAFLAALSLAALAGCTDRTDSSAAPATTTATDDAPTAGATATGARPTPDADDALDLREANVTGVSVAPADGAYRFDVTLHHDDDGENGYANWWQVESLAGDRLGRRELLHPHGTRPFTRSETVSVPEGACVVVRGHDETHGYGGQAALVVPETGAVRLVRQGSAPRAFGAEECP